MEDTRAGAGNDEFAPKTIRFFKYFASSVVMMMATMYILCNMYM